MSEWDSSETDTSLSNDQVENLISSNRGRKKALDNDDKTLLLKDLEDKYVNTNSSIAYSDAKTIYNYYKGKISYKEIAHVLSTKDGYTLTKRSRRARYYNPTYCRKLRQNLQLDVFYMQEFSKENDGYIHILIGVEVWSRFMWAVPLKSTSALEGLRGTKEILNQTGHFSNITVDKGSEFISNKYKKYIKSLNTTLHYTNSKASIAERAILTLKRYIYRYMGETDKLRYIHLLPNFVKVYNDHFHRFLQMSPRQAEMQENQQKVKKRHNKIKKNIRDKRQKPKFKMGAKVRLSRIKNRMTRGFDNTHNYEIFEITKIDTNLPIPRYYVTQPETGEKIHGCFYGNELVLVRQHKFKIVILKERMQKGKKEYFVKWKGYNGNFNKEIKCRIVFKFVCFFRFV